MPDIADHDEAAELHEAALHRGLRLVKSRKRKPGTGDYGKFGLVDSDGNRLLGYDDDTLTATPDDIRAYLRKSELSTWARSARDTPDKPVPVQAAKPGPVDQTDKAPSPRQVTSRKRTDPQPKPAKPRREVKARAEPKPAPVPELSFRMATAADAGSLAVMLAASGSGGSAAEMSKRLSAVAPLAPVMIADRGGVIGCVQWQVLATLHAGPVGRILLVVVARDERRRGIGRTLVEHAVRHLARDGCDRVEAMSDIEVRNVHGFFRALDFTQQSYRFVRAIASD